MESDATLEYYFDQLSGEKATPPRINDLLRQRAAMGWRLVSTTAYWQNVIGGPSQQVVGLYWQRRVGEAP